MAMKPEAPVMLTAETVIVLPSLVWSETSMLPVTAAPAVVPAAAGADVAAGALVDAVSLSSLPHAPRATRPSTLSPTMDDRALNIVYLLFVLHDEGAVHGGVDLTVELVRAG